MSPTILWLIASAVFIGIEILGIPGIGFLFAGIGALLIGGAIEFGLIAPENTQLQFMLFFIAACVSAALLWKRLASKRKPSYSNLVGSEALVAAPGLTGNKEGQIQWSGTLMRARLMPNDGTDLAAENTPVTIHRLEGNLAYVVKK